MYLKSSIKVSISLLLLIIIFVLSACDADSTVSELKFSFSTSTPSNYSSDEKTIYINNDMDKLELNADLKIDSGEISIQILNTTNEEVLWSGNYKEDSIFTIELFDLKADSEFLLKVEATQTKNVELVITSDNKIAKDAAKPDKYRIDKAN